MSFGTIAQGTIKPLTDFRDYVDRLANAVLKPKDAKGIAGFVFDMADTETLENSSQITDHYMEDGSFLNDHVIDNPIRITLTGFVGELVAKAEDGLAGLIGQASSRLTQVSGFLGQYTPGMTQTIQGALSATETYVQAANTYLDRTKNLVDAVAGAAPQPTQQEVAYQTLKALKDGRQLLSVTTPWSYHEDMMIESITPTQSAESTGISSFSVTLKQVRFAEVEVTLFDENLFPARSEVQSAEEVNEGLAGGASADSSILFEVFS